MNCQSSPQTVFICWILCILTVSCVCMWQIKHLESWTLPRNHAWKFVEKKLDFLPRKRTHGEAAEFITITLKWSIQDSNASNSMRPHYHSNHRAITELLKLRICTKITLWRGNCLKASRLKAPKVKQSGSLTKKNSHFFINTVLHGLSFLSQMYDFIKLLSFFAFFLQWP